MKFGADLVFKARSRIGYRIIHTTTHFMAKTDPWRIEIGKKKIRLRTPSSSSQIPPKSLSHDAMYTVPLLTVPWYHAPKCKV